MLKLKIKKLHHEQKKSIELNEQSIDKVSREGIAIEAIIEKSVKLSENLMLHQLKVN